MENLNEQLVTAKINDLHCVMQQDKELAKFLTTPAKELPIQYRYIVQEINNNENETLYNLINVTCNYYKNTVKSYFSKVGTKLTGFIAYAHTRNNDEIYEIKMFSFNPNRSATVFLADVIHFFDELTKTYKKITWAAIKENPANKIYQKAIEKYGGISEVKGNEVHYRIETTSPN